MSAARSFNLAGRQRFQCLRDREIGLLVSAAVADLVNRSRALVIGEEKVQCLVRACGPRIDP